MNCPKCGAPLLQGAVFCGACGYRLAAAAAPNASAGSTGSAAASQTSQAHGIHIDQD
ncbi:MAG: zinc-ribbon domain-containing protein, partial [Acidobacteriota bacterium]|nr:zinc-ribbon domain-containing protein [Acidobacteriota bacterium]